MRTALLVVLCLAAAEDLITAEIRETDLLISMHEQHLTQLKTLKQEFTTSNLTIPVSFTQSEADFRDFQTKESMQSHQQTTLEQLFLKKADLQLGQELADFDLFALTTGARETGLIALCYRSGLVTVHETNGREIGNFTLNRPIDTCHAFATSEELTIAVASRSYLVLTTLRQSGVLQVHRQNETPLKAELVGIRVSSRGAKRMWLGADTQGVLSTYNFNGTLIRNTSVSEVGLVGLESSGYSLIVVDKKQVTVVNLGTGETILRCEAALAPITSFASDGSPIVWALLENGSLVVYDTQYSSGGATSTCKGTLYSVLAHIQSHYIQGATSLAAYPGAALIFHPNGILTYVNATFLDSESFPSLTHIVFPSLQPGENVHIKAYKTGFGAVIVGVTRGANLLLFEVLASYRPPSNETWIDFGLVRIGAIIIAVLFVVYWNSRKTPVSAEAQAEQLQDRLGKLEKTMRDTHQFTEEVNKRLDAAGLREMSRKLQAEQD